MQHWQKNKKTTAPTTVTNKSAHAGAVTPSPRYNGTGWITILENGCKLPLQLPKSFEKENLLPSHFLRKHRRHPFLTKELPLCPKAKKTIINKLFSTLTGQFAESCVLVFIDV